MKHKIFPFLGVMLLVLALTVMPGWQGRATASTQPLVVSKTVSAAQLRAGAAYWTHDAMVNAKPLPMPQLKGSPVGKNTPANAGTPGSVAPVAAAQNADSLAQKAYPSDWQVAPESAISSNIDPAGTSAVYTSYAVNNWSANQTIYPHKWVGRLYISGDPGSGYCSATAQSGNTFVTAAHCVYDLTYHEFFNYWAFSPAYRAGVAPYGTFPGITCWVLTAWTNQASYSFAAIPYDVAVCTVGTDSYGYTLNYLVGNAGRTWGQGATQSFFTMGYPWEDTNSNYLNSAGYYLRTCASESALYATDVLRTGCNWGPGISGGPWLIGYSQNSVTGWVDSVVSGYVQGTPNLYGIRFASYNIQVICGVAGC